VIEKDVTICNKRGLHARAAARFVHLASGFDSHVTVVAEGEEADGKSILSLMVLGASQGMTIRIRAEGPDEDRAIERLSGFIEGRCDEED
jgi:phosphocarrier protein HPr